MRSARFGLVLAGMLVACAGDAGDTTPLSPSHEHPQPKPALLCTGVQPGRAPLRRLTRAEYNNTVRDLLGDTSNPADAFVREEEQNGFNNNAEVQGMTPILAEQLMLAAENVAARATEHLADLVPCLATAEQTACMRRFIASFGERAYRGPLDEDEVDHLYAVFASGLIEDARTGIELVLQTMLQSPRFLYRIEFGDTASSMPVVRLSSWEMASRLSYLFWNSMPDEALFAAARTDQLRTKEQIVAQAERLLVDPRTRATAANFHAQWLGLAALATATKSRHVFPAFSEAIRTAMRSETEMFLDDAVWEGPGDLATLLAAPYSFMNADLAAFYGLTGPAGSSFERVELDTTQRIGLLTQGSLLSINAHSDQTSPVTRGKFIRQRFFCQDPPPPPPDVMAVAPSVDPNLTTRERFAAHAESASCASCHRLMDPIGLTFEHYDGVGRYRSFENGRAIDASGSLVDTDVDGPFTGVPELVSRLLESQQVRDCVVTQWFRFAYGRGEGADDACNLRMLEDQFDASKSNIRSLLLALTQTDAFLYRPAVIASENTP